MHLPVKHYWEVPSLQEICSNAKCDRATFVPSIPANINAYKCKSAIIRVRVGATYCYISKYIYWYKQIQSGLIQNNNLDSYKITIWTHTKYRHCLNSKKGFVSETNLQVACWWVKMIFFVDPQSVYYPTNQVKHYIKSAIIRVRVDATYYISKYNHTIWTQMKYRHCLNSKKGFVSETKVASIMLMKKEDFVASIPSLPYHEASYQPGYTTRPSFISVSAPHSLTSVNI